MIVGRRMAHQYQQGMAEFLPAAYGASFLVTTAPALGIRESRRIIGDYHITVKDFLERKSFPDEIGRNKYGIDVHSRVGKPTKDKNVKDEYPYWEAKPVKDNTIVDEYMQWVASRQVKGGPDYGKGESHGIPYRSLIPKGLTNVLVAGKNIASDREVQGSVRVMPPALVTGQAAGTAAALAASEKKGSREIDVDTLRARLRKDGAYFL
jgi:hypothetical protein